MTNHDILNININNLLKIEELKEKLKDEISLFPDDDMLDELLNEYFILFQNNLNVHNKELENITKKDIVLENIIEEDGFYFITSTQYIMYLWVEIYKIYQVMNKKKEFEYIEIELSNLMNRCDQISSNFNFIKEKYNNDLMFFLNNYAIDNNIKNEDFNKKYFEEILK